MSTSNDSRQWPCFVITMPWPSAPSGAPAYPAAGDPRYICAPATGKAGRTNAPVATEEVARAERSLRQSLFVRRVRRGGLRGLAP